MAQLPSDSVKPSESCTPSPQPLRPKLPPLLGDLDTRLYYLQNWRHDVVVLMTYLGAIQERLFYDACGGAVFFRDVLSVQRPGAGPGRCAKRRGGDSNS